MNTKIDKRVFFHKILLISIAVAIMFGGLFILSAPIIRIRTHYNNILLPIYANGITGLIKGVYIGLFLRIVISVIRGKRNGKLALNPYYLAVTILIVIMIAVFGINLLGALGFDIPFLLLFMFLFLSVERVNIEK